MIGNTRETIGQIGLWLDAIHFAALDDGVQAGGALSAGVGATKEVILASQDRRFYGAVGGGVWPFQGGLCGGGGPVPPTRPGITKGPWQGALSPPPGGGGVGGGVLVLP